MTSWFKKCGLFLASKVVIGLVDLLFFTCRVETLGKERVASLLDSECFAFATWHGRAALFFTSVKRGGGVAVMTSRSKDGEIAATLQSSAGCRPFRGSTRKGGADALVKMSQYMVEKKKPAILSVDGPTGPIYKTKPGIVRLASSTGFPILPLTFSAQNAKIFRSWDRCIVPKPFSKATVIYGEPIYVPEDLTNEDLEKYLAMVDEELMRITLEADQRNNQCPKALKTDVVTLSKAA